MPVVLLVLPVELPGQREKQSVFHAAHQRREEIADHQAPDKRCQNAHQAGNGVSEDLDVPNRKVKQECRGDNAERRYSPIEISLIPIKTPPHRRLLSRTGTQTPVTAADILLSPSVSVKHFGLPLTGISHERFLRAGFFGYVNRFLDFMHFHSVENPVQKVENPRFFAISFSF